jgi:hypothetical protein
VGPAADAPPAVSCDKLIPILRRGIKLDFRA